MGLLLGNAVRFGKPSAVMAAGEGIETVLSLLSLFFRRCPWRPVCPPRISPPCSFRRAFAGFMFFATTTRRANLRKYVSPKDAARPASIAAP